LVIAGIQTAKRMQKPPKARKKQPEGAQEKGASIK
jgi:hypothetical protein